MFRPGLYPDWVPRAVKRSIHFLLAFVIWLKWQRDSDTLPLQQHDWPLYLDIHVVAALRLRRLPNLKNPTGFNDQMKWLMLFGQHPLMPLCVDKFEVRRHVAREVGKEHLVPLRAHGYRWDDIVATLAEGEGVLKCSHDSGSARPFDSLDQASLPALQEHFEHLLEREHGVGKGEWYYGYFQPRLIVEERLKSGGTSPMDIKIHCVGGEPRLIHVIDGRHSSQQAQGFYLPDGSPTEVAVKPHRGKLDTRKPLPSFELLLPLATKLSEPFRYVRVDFYLVGSRPYFGELSFHEQAGLFQSQKEETDLARALEIKCENPSSTIHTMMPRNFSR